MSTDERPESLAAQAAAWVPPWERTPAVPDPGYAAAVRAAASDDAPGLVDDPDVHDDPDVEGDLDPASPQAQAPTADADADADADDVDGDVDGDEGGIGADVPVELPPLPGEATGPATVDAPQPMDGDESDPTDVDPDEPDVVAPDLPHPEDEPVDVPAGGGVPVDAPAPADGDAGSVFDTAADDDVPDGDEVDLPAVEPGEVHAGEESSGDPDASADRAGEPAPDEEPSAPVGAAGRSAARRDRSGSGIPAQGRGKGDKGSAAGAAGRRTAAGLPGEPDVAGGAAAPDEADTLPPIDDSELRAALEAILLVVDEPVAELQLAQIMEQPAERVAAMLEDISASYTAAGHGFDLRRSAGGWRLYTRPEYAPYVERFVLDGQSTRLTQAALETLAVVAYKQPVSRSRISVIRGVNCDGVMRTLVTRGLIEECGTEPETGAFLYRTTVLFLEKLGLNSVDQLPALAPFLPDDVEEVFDAQR